MKAKVHIADGSFDWAVVREALRRTIPREEHGKPARGLASQNDGVEVSVLINDVFGGEILKTHTRRGWHFYNRIGGERIDLSVQETSRVSEGAGSGQYMDSPAEADSIVEWNDYTKLFLRFVRALEETVGLGSYQRA